MQGAVLSAPFERQSRWTIERARLKAAALPILDTVGFFSLSPSDREDREERWIHERIILKSSKMRGRRPPAPPLNASPAPPQAASPAASQAARQAVPEAAPPVSPRTAPRDLTQQVRVLELQVVSLARMTNCSTTISAMTTGSSAIIKNHFVLGDVSDRQDPLLGFVNVVEGNVVQVPPSHAVRGAAGFFMDWRDTEPNSVPRYTACLTNILNLVAPGFEVLPVHNDKKLLDTSARTLPIALRGTTDVIIRPRRSRAHNVVATVGKRIHIRSVLHDLTDMRVVVQLKLDVTRDYARYVNQSIAELFAADLRAISPVVAVLTDLNNDWTYLWLSRHANGEQRLHTVRLQNKQDGVQALAAVLSRSLVDLVRTHGLCKVRNLATATLL